MRARAVGSVRLPLAGPYRPLARLFQLPDGRLLWHVRLWEVDRPVPHLLPTWVLLRYARSNGLRALEAEIRTTVADAVEASRVAVP